MIWRVIDVEGADLEAGSGVTWEVHCGMLGSVERLGASRSLRDG